MRNAGVWVLSLFMIVSVLFSMIGKRAAYDELYHWGYGLKILELQSDRLSYPNYVDDSKMPVTALNAIPCHITDCPVRRYEYEFMRLDLMQARSLTLIFSVFLGYFLFCWATRWYGRAAGYLVFLLYVFSPNILAHSRYISTDIYAAGFSAFAVYFFWKYMNGPSWRNAWASAATLALAQLAKFTCIFLYPIFLCILLVRSAPVFCGHLARREHVEIFKGCKRFVKISLFFVAASLLIINTGYFFNKTLTPLRDYGFKSDAFLKLQRNPLLAPIPVPLPYPYIQGLDMCIFNEKSGNSIGNIYLLGKAQQVRSPEYKGFKGYYLIVSLFKVPIPTLLIFFTALFVFLKNRRETKFWEREVFIIVPILFYVVYLNFFYRMHIGIRHYLIIFPLVFLFCGSLLAYNRFQLKRRWAGILIVLCLCLAASVYRYFPHFLPYVNELLPDSRMAYKIFADSNLDMGGYDDELYKLRERAPHLIYEPQEPVSGKIIVGTNSLVGIFDPEKFRWLRENFEPVGHVAYTHLIFDVSEEDLQRIKP